MKISILAGAAVLAATGAMAAPPSEEDVERTARTAPAERAATAAEPEGEPQDEKKICRTERATGSLTRRTRICLTQAQWRDLNNRTLRGVSEMQGQGSGSQQVNRDAERTAGGMGGF